MLEALIILEVVAMIALPVAVWLITRRHAGVSWGLIGAGAISFIASQVAHIPLNTLLAWVVDVSGVWPFEPGSPANTLAIAACLGLLAGAAENLTRYLILRHWRTEARSWIQGVAFGAGHGGAEVILIALLALAGLVSMIALRGADPTTLDLPADALIDLEAQLEAYWSTPWYLPLVAVLERASTLTLHIALTLLVLKAITDERPAWLLGAILIHSVLDAITAWLIQSEGPIWVMEGVVLLFAALGAFIIYKLRHVSRETSP